LLYLIIFIFSDGEDVKNNTKIEISDDSSDDSSDNDSENENN